MAVLINNSEEPYTVRKGDKVAQMILEQIAHTPVCREVSSVGDTVRGSGGFGHTDTKPSSPCTPALSTPCNSTQHAQRTSDEHATQGLTSTQAKGKRKELILGLLNGTPYAGLRVWPHRIIVELCCSATSTIGAAAGTYSKGCLVVRITEKDDFNSEYGIAKVMGGA